MTNIFSILCLAMVVGRFASISATKFFDCKIESCMSLQEMHAMCKYASSQPSANCMDWTKQGFTDSEKKIIVDKLNELRQQLASERETRENPGPQPAAVSMPNLQWDNDLDLEFDWQRSTNHCNFNNNKCRNEERFPISQIMSVASSDNNLLDLKDLVHSFGTRSQGYYSQILRAKTKLIGCGRMTFKDSDDRTAYYIVCSYGPNFPGEKDMRFRNKTIQSKLSNLQSSDMKKNKKDKYKQHVLSLYQYNRITVNEKKNLNISLSK